MHVGSGTFFQNLRNARSDADVYRHELGMADLAEPLGFDSVWQMIENNRRSTARG